MRKFLVLLLLAGVLGWVSACKTSEPPAEPEPPAQTEPEPEPEVEPVKEVKPEVLKPVQTPAPKETIPSDISELNRKGYLKDIHFDFDKYDLKDDGKDVLFNNAQWLRDYPTIKILIEGHCDERGTRDYNLALGEKRASTARDYLVSLGIEPERIDVISYGEDRPFGTCHNETCWWQNRRAHFKITAR